MPLYRRNRMPIGERRQIWARSSAVLIRATISAEPTPDCERHVLRGLNHTTDRTGLPSGNHLAFHNSWCQLFRRGLAGLPAFFILVFDGPVAYGRCFVFRVLEYALNIGVCRRSTGLTTIGLDTTSAPIPPLQHVSYAAPCREVVNVSARCCKAADAAASPQ